MTKIRITVDSDDLRRTAKEQIERWRTVLGESCDPEPEQQSPVSSTESLDGVLERLLERMTIAARTGDPAGPDATRANDLGHLAAVLSDTRAAVRELAETVQALEPVKKAWARYLAMTDAERAFLRRFTSTAP